MAVGALPAPGREATSGLSDGVDPEAFPCAPVARPTSAEQDPPAPAQCARTPVDEQTSRCSVRPVDRADGVSPGACAPVPGGAHTTPVASRGTRRAAMIRPGSGGAEKAPGHTFSSLAVLVGTSDRDPARRRSPAQDRQPRQASTLLRRHGTPPRGPCGRAGPERNSAAGNGRFRPRRRFGRRCRRGHPCGCARIWRRPPSRCTLADIGQPIEEESHGAEDDSATCR